MKKTKKQVSDEQRKTELSGSGNFSLRLRTTTPRLRALCGGARWLPSLTAHGVHQMLLTADRHDQIGYTPKIAREPVSVFLIIGFPPKNADRHAP